MKVLTHRVVGNNIKTELDARQEFWNAVTKNRTLKEAEAMIEIDQVTLDQGGWVVTYLKEEQSAPAAEPKVRPKCHVLSCLEQCLEESTYCAKHQMSAARFFDSAQPTQLMPSLISVTGWNPRKVFDRAKLDELKASIAEHGILEPLLVRPKGSRYELVLGERRLRAARELVLEHVPVTVRMLDDDQVFDIMMHENLHRDDLNPIEEAHALKRILEISKLTQTELGRRMGKSQEWVSLRLRLAEAPAVLQDLIIRRQINPSGAVELLGWRDTDHFDALMKCVQTQVRQQDECTVKRVREIIKTVTEQVCPITGLPEKMMSNMVRDFSEAKSTEDLIFGRPTLPTEQNEPEHSTPIEDEPEPEISKEDPDEEVESKEEEKGESDPTLENDDGLLSCNCRDESWSRSEDSVYNVIRMTEHLIDAKTGGASPKCHDKAVHKLAKAMLESPLVMAVLRDQFTGGI